MRNRSAHRGRASLLALILLAGGIGLPALDAVWFHSEPAVSTCGSASPAVHVAGGGQAHVFGCAVVTSASSSRALPASQPAVLGQNPRLPAVAAKPAAVYQTEPSLQLSRAPPAV